MSDLRKLHEAATSGPLPGLRLPLTVPSPRTGRIWGNDGDALDVAENAVLIAAWLNAAPLILDVLDAARKDNRGISWSKNVADALAALDAHLEASKPKP